MNSFVNPMLILCDFETISRSVSLNARRRERNIMANEDGAGTVSFGTVWIKGMWESDLLSRALCLGLDLWARRSIRGR